MLIWKLLLKALLELEKREENVIGAPSCHSQNVLLSTVLFVDPTWKFSHNLRPPSSTQADSELHLHFHASSAITHQGGIFYSLRILHHNKWSILVWTNHITEAMLPLWGTPRSSWLFSLHSRFIQWLLSEISQLSPAPLSDATWTHLFNEGHGLSPTDGVNNLPSVDWRLWIQRAGISKSDDTGVYHDDTVWNVLTKGDTGLKRSQTSIGISGGKEAKRRACGRTVSLWWWRLCAGWFKNDNAEANSLVPSGWGGRQ